MPVKVEEVIVFKTIVVCDGCEKETVIQTMDIAPLDFKQQKRAALDKKYTFSERNGSVKTYCEICRMC